LGALLLLGTGVIGFISMLLHLASGNRVAFKSRKILFFAAILLFFIVAGLIELTHLK
jgi:hypothetical protein